MKKEVTEGLEIIARIRPVLLARFAEFLNEYHQVNYPIAYYDLLGGMWLEQLMHVSYAAWLQVKEYPMDTEENPIWEIASSPEEYLTNIIDSTLYHYHLKLVIQKIIDNENPDSWIHQTSATIIHGFSHSRRGVSLFKIGKILSKKVLSRIALYYGAQVLICAPAFKCSRKHWVFALFKWRRWLHWDDMDELISVPVVYDYEWRIKRFEGGSSKKDFSGILSRLLPLYIPAVFLEGFENFRKCVWALNKPRPKIVYTANALHFNLTFKFLAAEWKEQGTILVGHQHGGGYGLDKIHVIEDFETRVVDCFYSWGWKGKTQKVKPLSIGLHRAKRVKNSSQILLNCVDFPKNLFRFHFHPMPGTIERMISETVAFVSAFRGQKFNLMIRPYPKDYGWGFLDKLKEAAPVAKYDVGANRPKFFVRYAQSRLVVHNYLGTSWLETLALNIPTVCFFDPETYDFRQDAKPFIEALEKVGILHRSGKEAAHFVFENWENLEIWWGKIEVQKARSAFCANYANFSPDWQHQWETEFKSLLVKHVN